MQASDGGTMEALNWFKVTVTVTDVEEDGKLAEWTVDADGDADLGDQNSQQVAAVPARSHPDRRSTRRMMTATVSNVAWQWYRSSSSTSGWTEIADATIRTYIVSDTSTDNDVEMYLRVEATYSDPRGPGKTASFVSINPVQAARDRNTPPAFTLSEVTRVIREKH